MVETFAVVETVRFSNSEELAKAISDLTAAAGAGSVVYVRSDGFDTAGQAVLCEKTLTDGSKVYDIELQTVNFL